MLGAVLGGLRVGSWARVRAGRAGHARQTDVRGARVARRRAARHGRAEHWRRAAGRASTGVWVTATRGARSGARGRHRQGRKGQLAGRPVRVWCA